MKTTELKDRDGKPIRVGTTVKTFVQGANRNVVVKRLRPRSGEVVVYPGGYYKPASACVVQ